MTEDGALCKVWLRIAKDAVTSIDQQEVSYEIKLKCNL